MPRYSYNSNISIIIVTNVIISEFLSAQFVHPGTPEFTILSILRRVKDKNESANTLSNDLILISKWAYNWKMLFNSDPSKPTQEILFSSKKKKDESEHKNNESLKTFKVFK